MLRSRNKIISVIEILLGIILFIREVYLMITLPSIHDDIYGGLIDLFKYKENTHFLILLWILLIAIGIVSWFNVDRKWISNKILVMAAVLIFIIGVTL